MTTPHQANDITVVTAPDFAAPQGGTVLAIMGGKDFPYQQVLQYINDVWYNEPLVVYVQPIDTSADLARAKSIYSVVHNVIFMADTLTPTMALLLGVLDDDCVVVSRDPQWVCDAAYMGLTATDSYQVAVDILKNRVAPN